MENKIVILTDVVLKEHDFQRDLFYTGITRVQNSFVFSATNSLNQSYATG